MPQTSTRPRSRAILPRMSHRFAAILLAVALVLAGPLPAFATIQGTDRIGSSTVTDRGLTIKEAPTVECAYGILCNSDGTVLWARNPDEHSAMASTTKIMTAIVALENGDPDASYEVSANAAAIGESSAGLKAGMKVSFYDLMCCLLVHSGNDAAAVLAEGIAGSEERFAVMMNEKASQMGLQNTHFTNPHGLDAANHYTSASDLCVIARYAMRNDTFRNIVAMKKVKLELGGENVTFTSTNSLLNTWDECIGIKTGYTNNAGYCLASAAQRDGLELYAVVLGCSNEAERFTDSYKLLDWGFAHYRSYDLAKADDVLAEVPHSGYTNRTLKAGVAEDVSGLVLDYDGDISVDVKTIDLPDGADEGEQVGSVTWRQGEELVASVPLVAKESAGSPLPPIAMWTAFCRLLGVITGDDCVADGSLYAQTIEVTRKDDLAGEEIDNKLEKAIRKDAADHV